MKIIQDSHNKLSWFKNICCYICICVVDAYFKIEIKIFTKSDTMR